MDKPEFWVRSGELPGILRWALAGLFRLRQRGCFERPRISVKATEEYKLDSNTARRFLTERYEPGDDDSDTIVAKEIYAEYQASCKESGCRSLGDAEFGKEIRRVFPTQPEFLGAHVRANHHLAPEFGEQEKPEAQVTTGLPASAPPGTRTPNLLIKSRVAVYSLSATGSSQVLVSQGVRRRLFA